MNMELEISPEERDQLHNEMFLKRIRYDILNEESPRELREASLDYLILLEKRNEFRKNYADIQKTLNLNHKTEI